MRNLKKSIAFIVACSALAASSFATTPNSYKVSTNISHAGKSFAKPSAVVLAGQTANIDVAGADAFQFAITLKELAEDQIQVAVNLDSAHGSMQPTVIVHPNKTATISVDDLSLELTVAQNDR